MDSEQSWIKGLEWFYLGSIIINSSSKSTIIYLSINIIWNYERILQKTIESEKDSTGKYKIFYKLLEKANIVPVKKMSLL